MTRGLLRWWRRRSLRARLTLLASGLVTAGLVVGASVLAAVFVRARYDAIGATALQRASDLAALVASDRLPTVLPSAGSEVAQVLDSSGAVLATTTTATRTLPLLQPEELEGLPRGRAVGREATPFTTGPVRLVVVTARSAGTGAGPPVTIVVAEPLGDLVDTLRALRAVLVFAVPLLVGVVALTCWMLVGSALRPVEALRRGADTVGAAAGSSDPAGLPVPDGEDEVAALARTLNRMLARLAAAGARQRGFVADAAHELRSPLTSLRTQLEVAQALDEVPAVEDLLAEVVRLGRLVDDLLVLARLDAPRTDRPVVAVDLAALARTAGAEEVRGTGSALGDPEALRRVVVNLLANARRHAAAQVRVEVSPGCLAVDDDGPGVPVDARERVFERFTRLDDARARDHGGSGLGLAIARETARASGGDVTLGESPLGGASFVLHLPPG